MIFTVIGPVASTEATLLSTIEKSSELRPSYWPRYASRLFFTTSAFRSVPSWNFTPSRIWIVHWVASLFDFTDSANPKEIAYFDRGPIDFPNATGLNLGGFWSTYFYNGRTFGTEIARGFDVFRYTPTDDLSSNEIAAAGQPVLERMNAQLQAEISWEPSFAVVRSHLDQLVRADAIDAKTLGKVTKHLEAAETATEGKKAKGQLTAAAAQLPSAARYDALRGALQDLAATY